MKQFGLLSVLALLLTFAPAAAAGTQPVVRVTKVPINSVTIPGDFCFGVPSETIDVSGTANLVTVVSVPAFHTVFHLNTQGVLGVGETTGTTYHFNSVQVITFNETFPFPEVVTASFKMQLIGNGAAANVSIEVVTHFTINANGDITAQFGPIGHIDCG
jgi:hypothetical protein